MALKGSGWEQVSRSLAGQIQGVLDHLHLFYYCGYYILASNPPICHMLGYEGHLDRFSKDSYMLYSAFLSATLRWRID
jgi:hypothetical protein